MQPADRPAKRSAIDTFLTLVERGGNALPHPSTLFLGFSLAVIAISDLAVRSGIEAAHPGTGEIIGGSQREERLDVLERRLLEANLAQELWWYLDLRRYGTVPHSGFGLGFERLINYVTGMSNIRDVIPFPRTPRNASF